MNVSPTDATVCLSIVHLYRHTWAMVTVWRSANGIGRINEVTLRGARLVLGWVTVFGRAYTPRYATCSHQGWHWRIYKSGAMEFLGDADADPEGLMDVGARVGCGEGVPSPIEE